MDRDIRCPVCRASVRLADDPTRKDFACQVCGTKIVLPQKRRAAADGEPQTDG